MSGEYHTEPFTRPPEEITIVPKTLDYAYMGHAHGQDAYALRVTDAKVGEVALILSESAAMNISQHLLGMVAEQDTLRAEWHARNPSPEGGAE